MEKIIPYLLTNGSYIIAIAKPVFKVSATNRYRTYRNTSSKLGVKQRILTSRRNPVPSLGKH
jgi:hypothetical protein